MPTFTTGLPAFMSSMSQSSVVSVSTAAVTVVGISVYTIFKASMAGKVPSTITPEWKRATIKYRAAQVQDPISNP